MFESSNTTLIISYKEMNDIMKIMKVSWRIWFIDKRVSEAIKNDAK